MLAYKISVNGKHLVTAGQEDWKILTMHVTAGRDNLKRGIEDYIRLYAGGLSKESVNKFNEHFRYKEFDLEIDDKIEIQIVDVKNIDHPQKRYRSDKEVQENPFTEEEIKNMRYKDYLDLKKEFEGDIDPNKT